MGIGDEIIASGHALSEHRRTGRRIRITDRRGNKRWSEMWCGLPWMEQERERDPEALEVMNGGGCRPYLRGTTLDGSGRLRFSDWRVRDHAGAIALTEAERAKAAGLPGRYILLEPHTKPAAGPNKNWGWGNWQRLAGLLRGIPLVQVGPRGTRTLKGARLVETSFREACGVVERAGLCILPEGGLHHAAGALKSPALVLFGGMIDPQVTGYGRHWNLADAGPGSPCSMRRACGHCRKVWQAITPEYVAEMALELLDDPSRPGFDLRIAFASGAQTKAAC